MQAKTCFKCKQEKPIAEFYKHSEMKDGRLNKCKDCTRKDTRANYLKNKKYYQEYDKRRNKEPERKKAQIEYARIKRKTYPQKYKANMIVGNALKANKIKKKPCIICGSSVQVEAHHEDYKKPLKVIWLCQLCHKKIHKYKTVLKQEGFRTAGGGTT